MEQTLFTAKALSDASRLRVLAMLMERDELCVCQITALLNLSTATVSKHMSILHGAHLVDSRKEGRWVFYSLARGFPASLREWLVDSMAGSREVAADRSQLESVLSCDRAILRQRQKAGVSGKD